MLPPTDDVFGIVIIAHRLCIYTIISYADAHDAHTIALIGVYVCAKRADNERLKIKKKIVFAQKRRENKLITNERANE